MNLNKVFKLSEMKPEFYSAVLPKKKFEEWILVLEAMDIPFTAEYFNNVYQLNLSHENKSAAFHQISLYEKENQRKRIQEKKISLTNSEPFVIFTPFILYLFHFAVVFLDKQVSLVSLGNASAEAVLSGEWWRTVTALTLHANLSHLFSNLIFGAIIATLVIRQTGGGIGWLLILLSGALGDYLNSLLFVKNHYSIGASTAVFGAVGVLSSLQFFKNYRMPTKKAWVALGVGLAFLAFFGSEGKNTDITAHFFGLFSGIFWGSIAGFILRGRKLNRALNFILLLSSLMIVLVSWYFAIKNPHFKNF